MIKLKEITQFFETFAPLSLQESYDNSGLIVGDSSAEISTILITLDVTEDVIEEAIKKKLIKGQMLKAISNKITGDAKITESSKKLMKFVKRNRNKILSDQVMLLRKLRIKIQKVI